MLKTRKARAKLTKESFPHGPQGQRPQPRVNARLQSLPALAPRLWKQRARGCCPALFPCPISYKNRSEGIREPIDTKRLRAATSVPTAGCPWVLRDTLGTAR